ncbi:MAG TPA: hypothetical protein VIW29_10835 [Polyangiaceae bacterium]
MGRKLLMVVLGLGAVAGFGAGFARLCHSDWRPGARFGHHAELERRVADACTESALRVYGRQSGAGEKP